MSHHRLFEDLTFIFYALKGNNLQELKQKALITSDHRLFEDHP